MLERGGLVVRRLSTRCMFSCLPFCWGEAGSMNSGKIWSWTNQTESLERRPRALEAKGSAIVGSDAVGKPELAEEPSEHRDYAIDGDIRAAVAGEQEARVHVLDGERVAEVTIAGRELALEVRAPALVGRIGRGVGPTGVPASDTPAALGDEIVPAQDVMDGGPRGQVEPGRCLCRNQRIFLAP